MKQWFGKSLYREMVIKVTCFLAIPFLIMTAFVNLKIYQDGENSYQANMTLVMEQAHSSRDAYIYDTLRLGDRISSNNELKGFFMGLWQSKNLTYYSKVIQNMILHGLPSENIYIPKIYYTNETIPQGLSLFYHLNTIGDIAPIAEFLESDEMDKWITPAEAKHEVYPVMPLYTPFKNHYTYMRRVMVEDKLVFLLTISINKDIMDKQIHQADPLLETNGEFFETETELFANFSDIPMNGEVPDLVHYKNGGAYIKTYENAMFPQKLTYIWRANPQRGYIIFAIIAIFLFVGIAVAINIKFIQNIFRQIFNCINVFGNSVKSGRYEKLEVTGENEISQINSAFNSLIDKVQKLIILNSKQSIIAKESQLKALQQQINPHFLYNTLEVFAYKMELYGHIPESDAMASFSAMLRYSIASDGKYATIRDEVEQVNNYINIQRLKHDDITFETAIPQALYDAEIIRFILQPLIENCFTHGYCGRPLRIFLSCIDLEDYVLFEICDNGSGLSPARLEQINQTLATCKNDKSIGIGLSNINHRLQLFYSNNCILRMSSEENKWTLITFKIPK